MDSLSNDIKVLIITTLNLEGMTPDEIETQAPLFGDGLGLDSIDALELRLTDDAVTRERQEQSLRTQLVQAGEQARVREVHIQRLLNENQEMREHFYSVESLARLISVQRG